MSLAVPNEAARRLRHGHAHRGPAASALFGRSVRLLDAADELERTAHESTDEDVLLESLGCLTAVLEAMATATLQLGLVARGVVKGHNHTEHARAPADGGDAPDAIASMLFGASQNLRIAAETARQAHRSLLATRVPRRA